MKPATDIRHASRNCWNGFQVKGQGHSAAICTFSPRHIDQRFAVENFLVVIIICTRELALAPTAATILADAAVSPLSPKW